MSSNGTTNLINKKSACVLLFLIIFLIYVRSLGRPPSNSDPSWLEELISVERDVHSLRQDDPRLIKYARYRYLTPPALPTEPYRLIKDINWPYEHTPLILKLFSNKMNGVFIESGANDGESSHTLKLEKEFGWTGVLIECNPTVVPYLISKRRKAWVAGVCLATEKNPQKVNFSNPVSWTYSGRFGKPWNLPRTNWTFFDVETMPLYTILTAIGMTTIDFWSLDVEGSEIHILKTIPFHLFHFKVIICEIQFFNEMERAELDGFMTGTAGFNIYTEHNFAVDRVFVHKSFQGI